MSLTKSQILQQLSVMDAATLNKLFAYSQMLIIPDADLLVNATKQQMEDWVKTNAPSLYPAWTAVGDPSDFGWFLVELFSLFSEKDFWYLNAWANEALLKKSHVYSVAFVKAVTLGYDPVVSKGASAQFNVVFPAGQETTYARGQLVVSLPGANLLFSNDAPFTVPTSAANQNIPLTLYEGTQAASNVSFNGNKILLTNQNIDIESIQVLLNNVYWRRVRLFGESNNTSTDFIALPEADGSASIEFGGDGFGIRPNVGDAITTYFRTCSGTTGNVASQQVLINTSNSNRAPIGVVMVSDATGGSNPESLASIKNNAPMYFSSKKAAINTTITKQIINQYPGVHNSNVYVVGNFVYFQLIPTDGSVASSTLLNAVQAYLTPFLMLGYTCSPKDTIYVNVAPLNITVSILKGTDRNLTLALIDQLIQDYTDPLVLADYGKAFDLTELNLLLKSQIPGVQNTIFNTVAGGSPASIQVDGNSVKKVINPNTDLIVNFIEV